MNNKLYGQVTQQLLNPIVSEPLPNKSMVLNNTGGYVFKVEDKTQLLRFLILGTTSNTYYQTKEDLTKQNVLFMLKMLNDEKSAQIVFDTVLDVSENNRAYSVNPTLLVYAAIIKLAPLSVKKQAVAYFNSIVRTGTHLFTFVEFMQMFGGWGRLSKEVIQNWYLSKKPEKLALQVIKYQNRNNWSHRDVLRKSHAKSTDAQLNSVLNFAVTGSLKADSTVKLLKGFELMKSVTSSNQAAKLMIEYGLPIETVPTEFRGKEVYRAALSTNGFSWLLRNLGNLSKLNLTKPFEDSTKEIISKLENVELMKAGRIHPMDVIKAKLVYGSGKGIKGSNSWTPDSKILDVLEQAFYDSFKVVEPTGKNILIGLDVSSSMSWGNIGGLEGFTPALAETVMAMVTARVEQNSYIKGFSTTLKDLGITAKDTLVSAMKKTHNQNFGSTNPGALFDYAIKNQLKVDAFGVYTDNEVNTGKHPSQLLEKFRQQVNSQAKFYVVGFTATPSSIASSTDKNSLDLVGFDSSGPSIISEFIRGSF